MFSRLLYQLSLLEFRELGPPAGAVAAIALLIPLPVLVSPQHFPSTPRAGPFYNNRL